MGKNRSCETECFCWTRRTLEDRRSLQRTIEVPPSVFMRSAVEVRRYSRFPSGRTNKVQERYVPSVASQLKCIWKQEHLEIRTSI